MFSTTTSKNISSQYGYPLPKIFTHNKQRHTDFMVGVGYSSLDQPPSKSTSVVSPPNNSAYPCGYRSFH